MSALTKDRNTVRRLGEYAVYPVKGGKVVFAGGMVCLGADGYALPAADIAGLKFAGVARGYVDNSGGADGALSVEVWRKGSFELACSGMTVANAGDAVYVLDDQTVGLAGAATNDVACGRASEVVSGSRVYVDIDRV